MHQDKAKYKNIKTSQKALDAVHQGNHLAHVQSQDGAKLWLIEYEGKLYGLLDEPISKGLSKVLQLLQNPDFLDEVLALEHPNRYFSTNEPLERVHFVRADLRESD